MRPTRIMAILATICLAAWAAPKVNEADQKHVTLAAEGGLAEVQFGKLAASKASNPKVKEFGEQMVKAHTAVNEELKGLSARNQFSLPNALNDEHQAAYKKLDGLSGEAFDKAYMDCQVKDHMAAYKVFSEGAKDSQNADLKKFFDKHDEHIKMHLDMAKSLDKADIK